MQVLRESLYSTVCGGLGKAGALPSPVSKSQQGLSYAQRCLRGAVAGFFGALAVLTMTGEATAHVSFQGKTITMIIGSPPGGGTDASGRIIARFLGQYLPGTPNVVTQNMPGASGITATNHFMNKTQPDGLTVLMGSQSILDPVIYRNATTQYDTTKIRMAGGIGRGGSLLFISKAAEPRLYDHTASPVVIGMIGPAPRAGIQPALWSIEYLGWNAKWVAGYPGTNQLMIAFDRGEVELTSTANIFLIEDRLKAGTAKVLFQTGSTRGGKASDREDFGDVPNFLDLMQGKISDPVAKKAYAYWVALSSVDKWLGLRQGTPDDIVETYRDAFERLSADQEFLDLGDKISDGFAPVKASAVEAFARTLAETPPEALGYLTSLMKKQGMRTQ
jgi:hypothetical protein